MDWESFYAEFRKPDFVPGYEIQNRLGGGAFGEVYKARKHSIGKAYAIKFLKLDGEGQRDAVERELEQVRHFAALDHPNLVTIEDLGIVHDVPYLVMGYAGDDTLAKRLRKGPLGRDKTLATFVQTCRGVLALHDRRLVHFDLKPGNVFLKGDDARVGDYGLSKLMVDGRMTLTFGRGTPQYMAPEMLRNRADHRADIYSLGVILFESLAGRLPFEAQGPSSLVLRETDEPPEFPPDFPADLRPIVERCLRLDPNDRYPDVAALLQALGHAPRLDESAARRRVVPELGRRHESEDAHQREREVPAVAAAAPSSAELKRTAAELAFGAVKVARGVWDGLRGNEEELAPSTRWSSEAAEVPFGRELARVPGAGGPAVATGLGPPAAPGELSLDPRWHPAARRGLASVPVPPRVVGPIPTFVTTVQLGFEVLTALGRGLVAVARRLLSKRKDDAEQEARSRHASAILRSALDQTPGPFASDAAQDGFAASFVAAPLVADERVPAAGESARRRSWILQLSAALVVILVLAFLGAGFALLLFGSVS